MIGVRFACLYYYSWHASKKLHEDMIEKILQAPVNLYFDITPIGKSLNKFSKDLIHLQGGFHYTIDGSLACSYSVIQVGLISVYAVWQIGLVFPFIIVASVLLMKKTLKSIKETGRLRATSSSPLISFLTESLNGVSTIRAFNLTEKFEEENYKLLNKNILATQMQVSVNAYFRLRVNMMVMAFMTVVTTTCIFVREKSDPVILAMVITYITQIQGAIAGLLFCYIGMES